MTDSSTQSQSLVGKFDFTEHMTGPLLWQTFLDNMQSTARPYLSNEIHQADGTILLFQKDQLKRVLTYGIKLPLSQYASLCDSILSWLRSPDPNLSESVCVSNGGVSVLAITALDIIIPNYNEQVLISTVDMSFNQLRSDTNLRPSNYRLYLCIKGFVRMMASTYQSFTIPSSDQEILICSGLNEGVRPRTPVFELRPCYDISTDGLYYNGIIYCSGSFYPIGDSEGIFHESNEDDYTECTASGFMYPTSDLTYLEYSDTFVNADNVTLIWCNWNDCHILEDEAVHGIIDCNRNSGYWHRDYEDSVYTEDDTYITNEVAEDNGCWFDSHDGEWREEHERRSHEYFDNPFDKYHLESKKMTLSPAEFKVLEHKLGISSITNRQFENMPYSFGVEIETNDSCDPLEACDNLLNVASVSDGSISGPEFVSGVLKGDSGANQLRRICEHIKEAGGTVNKTCGIHVHIGGAIFNRRFQLLSIMLGLQLQEELFAMQPTSRRSNSYCRLIPDKYYSLHNLFTEGKTLKRGSNSTNYYAALKLLRQYVTGDETNGFTKEVNKKHYHPNGHYCSSRYKWLNLNNCSFRNGPETIEFRQHSGTIEYNKIILWTKLCMAIVNFVENKGRRITIGFKHAYNYAKRNDMVLGNAVSIREIIEYSFSGDNANEIIEYVKARTEKFGML